MKVLFDHKKKIDTLNTFYMYIDAKFVLVSCTWDHLIVKAGA